jgi:hypothetical protein
MAIVAVSAVEVEAKALALIKPQEVNVGLLGKDIYFVS